MILAATHDRALLTNADHGVLLDVAEAILTRAGREIVGDNPLECSRSVLKAIRRLRWARRTLRAVRVGRLTYGDLEGALCAGCHAPVASDTTDNAADWTAFNACMAARLVMGLTGMVD